MFTAQLVLFLIQHHHQHWAELLTTMPPHKFGHVYMWAQRHGFVYQR